MPISGTVKDLDDGTHPDGQANGDNGSEVKSLPAEVGGAAGDMINSLSSAGKHLSTFSYMLLILHVGGNPEPGDWVGIVSVNSYFINMGSCNHTNRWISRKYSG